MQFSVRALDPHHQQVQTLLVEAADEADAREQTSARRLTPLSIEARRAWRGAGRRPFPLLLFSQELLALLSAGLSAIEALETLSEKEPDAARKHVLMRLARHLREGQRLSGAMRLQPAVFPPLFVGIVQAAEGTSSLPQALGRYLEYEGRLQAVRHKVVSAAIYPAILIVVGGAVCAFLLGFVVPRFAAVYQGSGRELPWASQMLMAWGELARQHTGLLVVALLAGVLSAGWWGMRAAARGGWLQLLGVLPGARPKLRVLTLSRLYLTVGMLVEGGIALHHALGLAVAVADDRTAAALQQARQRIEAGEPLSQAFSQAGLSTPVADRLLRVGEQSGQLGDMLGRAALFHDDEIARWIDRFSRAFEPVLMAAIGLVIGLVVVLLYLPIFELAGSLQ